MRSINLHPVERESLESFFPYEVKDIPLETIGQGEHFLLPYGEGDKKKQKEESCRNSERCEKV